LGKISAQIIPTSPHEQAWVDSIMTTLSIREQIAQSFMAAAYTHNDEPNAELIGLIQDLGIGGIIFMQGNPIDQAKVNTTYQKESEIPLFMATDAEWGLSMRYLRHRIFLFKWLFGH